MLANDIKGMDVISADGNVLGELEGIITEEQWKIKSITVSIDSDDAKEMGKKKPWFSALKMDIDKDYIDGIKDKVVLNKSIKNLGKHFVEHDKKNDATRILGFKILSKDGKLIGKVIDFKLFFIVMEDAEKNILHIPNNMLFQKYIKKIAG